MLTRSFILLASTLVFNDAFTVTTKSSHWRPTFIDPTIYYNNQQRVIVSGKRICQLSSSASSDNLELKRVPPSLENIPLPFIDPTTNSFIECFADSIVDIEGITYTIAVPCDYSVALCYFDEEEQLIPIELDDPLMDDVFPIAESIVAEEFGEELVLQRTPQTLTLVGELEPIEDDEDEDDDEESDEEDEEVEVLLSFEHREQEFSLVRLLDPILLVGKDNPDDAAAGEGDDEEGGTRLLLTPEESESVMPVLEDLFLKFHDSAESKL